MANLPVFFGRTLLSGIALLAVLALGATRSSLVVAQGATPVPVECVAPEVPPGTPSTDASPAAEIPVQPGSDAATPVVGTAADEATAAEIEAAVQNYIACYNTLDATKFVPLSTEAHRLAEYGTANLHDAIENAQALPNYAQPGAELISVSNVLTHDDGRVSAEVEVVLGGHWFLHLRQFFVHDGMHWLIDEDQVLVPDPDGDRTVVGVAVAEHTITPNVTEFEVRPVVVFHVQVDAAAAERHMVAVIQMPEGTDPTGILDGSVPLDQITFYGAVVDRGAGEIEDLALIDLEPGVYTLVSFGSDPSGTTHIELGMFTQVTITAPAS
jgi:hypothetical protein